MLLAAWLLRSTAVVTKKGRIGTYTTSIANST
jgi:hypothetical protein